MKMLRVGLQGLAVFLALALLVVPNALAVVGGTASRSINNATQFLGSSGSNAWSFLTNGLRGDFGTGLDDFITSNGTNLIIGTGSGAGYVASAVPVIFPVYVNSIIAATTYGGSKLPAHAVTVTDIGYNVRAAGIGGTTNNTFTISDGANTCTCTFACNQAPGSQIAACSNGAGTGCVYAASAALTYGFSAVGDCATPTDLRGNLEVRGKWQ